VNIDIRRPGLSCAHRQAGSPRVFFSGFLAVLVIATQSMVFAADPVQPVTFIFTSDVHFGITRGNFRGETNVESRVVNAAMVQTMNALPAVRLPADGGLKAGAAVGPIDFVVITGDLANRQELYPVQIQSATASWAQFATGYYDGLKLKNAQDALTPLLLVPGNHDVSNAIGSPSKLVPATDATSLAEIYNRMMRPATPRTKDSYSYSTDKIFYARDFGGAHFIFLTIWPDSAARAWMQADLAKVPATTPVFIFAHDPPEIEAKHLTNPNGTHAITSNDKFENVVGDILADGTTTDVTPTIEHRALAAFLKAHRNIVAYFHGHSNWNEFYTWKGPEGDLALPVFRADSPMKGKFSGPAEDKLSYQVVVFDGATGKLTARECLWNAPIASRESTGTIAWGASTTVRVSVETASAGL
jgi:hypothetical protein